MPYATKENLVARFGEIEVQNLQAMQSDPKAIENALQDATEEIDSYVGVKYSLPIADIPATLERVACNIARYNLYFQQPTEEVENRYKAEIRYLERVANGTCTLPILNTEKEVTSEKPQQSPSTLPIGASYTGGMFGDDVLDMMPSIHMHSRRSW